MEKLKFKPNGGKPEGMKALFLRFGWPNALLICSILRLTSLHESVVPISLLFYLIQLITRMEMKTYFASGFGIKRRGFIDLENM